MGTRIAACAAEDGAVRVAALLDQGDVPAILRQPSTLQSLADVDAIIDFSSDAGTNDAIALARALPAALLVGTTALSEATLRSLDELARGQAVMICANTSLGVAVARRLAREAARLLGEGYDVDIVETHHVKKLDAPSGTALALAASMAEAGRPLPKERVHAIRAGDVIGDHLVQFAGAGEIVQIRHTATTRDLFARGALRAARWLARQGPGRYRIDDTFAGA